MKISAHNFFFATDTNLFTNFLTVCSKREGQVALTKVGVASWCDL